MERQATDALVLLVEDDPAIRDLIATLLEIDLGVSVTVATDGAAGLELAKRLGPDLVLLDINLPRLSGLELARRLRSNPRTRAIPIVAVSSESREKALAAGCDDHVAKPFNVSDLIQRVRRYLCRHLPLHAEWRDQRAV